MLIQLELEDGLITHYIVIPENLSWMDKNQEGIRLSEFFRSITLEYID